MHALEGHSKEVQCVTWSPDTEGLLASCGQDCRVYAAGIEGRLFDLRLGSVVF